MRLEGLANRKKRRSKKRERRRQKVERKEEAFLFFDWLALKLASGWQKRWRKRREKRLLVKRRNRN